MALTNDETKGLLGGYAKSGVIGGIGRGLSKIAEYLQAQKQLNFLIGKEIEDKYGYVMPEQTETTGTTGGMERGAMGRNWMIELIPGEASNKLNLIDTNKPYLSENMTEPLTSPQTVTTPERPATAEELAALVPSTYRTGRVSEPFGLVKKTDILSAKDKAIQDRFQNAHRIRLAQMRSKAFDELYKTYIAKTKQFMDASSQIERKRLESDRNLTLHNMDQYWVNEHQTPLSETEMDMVITEGTGLLGTGLFTQPQVTYNERIEPINPNKKKGSPKTGKPTKTDKYTVGQKVIKEGRTFKYLGGNQWQEQVK